MSYLVCGIYDRRPAMCRKYPEPTSWMPDSCGFYFADGERKGCCYLECQAACCMEPRVGGEPGGAPMPEIAGGLPCKHLISVDEPPPGTIVEKPEE
jgi:hypothetical protein